MSESKTQGGKDEVEPLEFATDGEPLPEPPSESPTDAEESEGDPMDLLAEEGTLLPRVRELLTRIQEEDRVRYERFFAAASVAIEWLGRIDVAEDDAEPEEGQQFIDTLPEDARTAMDRLRGFLGVVKKEFPVEESESDDELDITMEATEEESSNGEDEVFKTLSAFAMNLEHELGVLTKALKVPAESVDRWSLLEQLGEFRGRSRSGIGEMVFLAARQFSLVRKEDVVPFYKEDVDSSLALRRSITMLRARVDVHLTRFQRHDFEKDQDGIRHGLFAFHGELDAFMATETYRGLRVVDRRAFLGLHTELMALVKSDKLIKKSVENTVEGLSKFLDSLSLMNQRELLVVHDRDAMTDTTRHLNAVLDAVAASDAAAARTALGRAVQRAQPLFGRDAKLDVLLKLFKHVELEEVGLDDLLAMAGLLRLQL